MSTHFVGEGNIGSAPDYREFPNGNDEPRRLLRLNVYFDNPIPKKDGEFEDRGGFWAPVELWHRDAEHWKTCTRRACACWSKAAVRDEWEDADENERVTFKIEARAWASCRTASIGDAQRQAGRRAVRNPSPSPRRHQRRTPAMHQPPGDSSRVVHRVPAALPKRRSCCASRCGLRAPLRQRIACRSQSGVCANRLPCCRHPLARPS
jgi:single-strand DNA-binding protein